MGKRTKRLTMAKYAKKYASIRANMDRLKAQAEEAPVTPPEKTPIVEHAEPVKLEVETQEKTKTVKQKKTTKKSTTSTRETFHEMVTSSKTEKTTAQSSSGSKTKRVGVSKTKKASSKTTRTKAMD
tara:strand:+ start:64 stop:441 length:378 start_codon:yes stop_codon:yes gene_type:complete